jgi:hypothetical protein
MIQLIRKRGWYVRIVKYKFGGPHQMDKSLWESSRFEQFFKSNEFDSPDLPESGCEMQYGFMDTLRCIRQFVNRPFIITSGFRTPEHNKELLAKGYKASINSPHLKGLACDIKILDSNFLYLLIRYSLFFKIKRIGISFKGNFCHIDTDNDSDKKQEIIWGYE